MTEWPHSVPLGESGLTVRLGEAIDPALNARVHALAAALQAAALPGVREIVPAYAALTVFYDPDLITLADLQVHVRTIALALPAQSLAPGREVMIPVRYDGPDLAEVAARTGLSEADVIARHVSRTYRVYVLGFVPGFAYLGELDPALVLPRRAEPRPRVPAGSVAIAGAQTGVYPLATPGGWHLIGRTDAALFDPQRAQPFLLQPGDHVRFEPVP